MTDSLTRLGSDHSRVAIPDLKAEFEKTVSEWGSHVIYVRLNKSINHECWDPVRQQAEGINVCPVCYGTGHPISIERHLSRAWSEMLSGREAQMATQTWPGVMMVGYRSFAFKPNVRPKEHDFIFEVEWFPEGRVRNLQMAYEVKGVNDMRQEQGILAYYKVYAAMASVNVATIETLLRKETRIRIVD